VNEASDWNCRTWNGVASLNVYYEGNEMSHFLSIKKKHTTVSKSTD